MKNETVAKEQSGIKRRIIISVLSIVLCLLLIGFSVFAATSQSFTSKNTITIGSSDQVRSGIKASYAFGAADEARKLFTNSEEDVTAVKSLSFTEIANKTYDQDSVTENGPDIVFSYDNKYTYAVYKIEFANQDASDVTYSIAFRNEADSDDYTFNSQITLYSGDGDATTLTQASAPYTGDILKGESKTVYVVVAVNEELIDLTAVAQQVYNLKITANQKAAG